MKVLKISTEVFMWLGIFPIDDKNNWRKQAMRYAIGFINVFFMSMAVLSSLAYIKQFFSSDLVATLYAVHIVVASICIIASFVALYLNREKFSLIARNFQKIYDQSKR